MNSDSYSSDFHFIKKFDKNGTLVDSWGKVGPKDGQFLHAHGITIDSTDNVYVSDAEKCNIQKFDKDGNFITMWGSLGCKDDQFLIPHDIAMDSKGYIYVTDSGKSHFRADYNCDQGS
jgi:DNA-binding beta-propeller fold protein YncE